jgi:hypothetical protein
LATGSAASGAGSAAGTSASGELAALVARRGARLAGALGTTSAAGSVVAAGAGPDGSDTAGMVVSVSAASGAD